MTSEITTQSVEGESSIYKNTDSFEFAQRQAKSLCESDLVPKSYQGQKGLPNCLVALEMSKRMKLSPLTVMQNLNIIHGTPTWSAQFITSQILGCGRFENFDYLIKGEGETLEVQCSAKRIADNKIVKGTPVSMKMARLEGWTRNSKYSSMPELMLRNRAATFFGRQYIPDLLLGVQTSEEVVDIQPLDVTPETVKETLDDHGM
ncbi:MAG: hypothetical protein CM15mV46_670 [Caudoviricetes sp.]|nr:MAG: hypothetical protein CM15mV46_670 [Caudoviricetes sp.]